MTNSIEVDVKDARRVFDLLGEVNHLFHQPLYFEDPEMVKAFAFKNYKEIHALYYNVVWDWLPEEVQKEIRGE